MTHALHLLRRSSFLRTGAALTAMATALSACATHTSVVARNNIDALKPQVERDLARARYVAPDAVAGPLRERAGLYLAGDTRENAHGRGLPSEWSKRNVSFVNSQAMRFREIADMITRQTGIPVVSRENDVGPSAASQANRNVPVGSQGDPAGGPNSATSPRLAAGPIPAGFDAAKALDAARAAAAGQQEAALAGGSPYVVASAGTMSVNYTGKLGGFLDLVGDSFNYGWVYENGRIAFSRTQVATFDIPALPMVMKLAFSLDSGLQSSGGGGSSGGGSGGGSGAGTSGSTQKATTDAAFNIWQEMEKTLKSIVGSAGTLDISGSTGTVTINAPRVVIDQARRYVQRINRELSRQIVLAVDVYSLRIKRSDNYNFDLNVLLSGSKAVGGYQSPIGPLGSTIGSVLASSPAGSNALGMTVMDGRFAGSSALLSALSSKGDVSIVQSANLTTLNGIPAPFQVVNTRSYVASVSTTIGGVTTGGSSAMQTSLQPGTVTTGFNLYVVPRVDRNGTVLLQYGMNISELVGANGGFDTFSSGGQTVQLPNINSRNFVQEASVPVGGTLVLTGFEQKTNGASASGLGDAAFPLLGGGRNANNDREIVVVSISPRVISFGPKNAVD